MRRDVAAATAVREGDAAVPAPAGTTPADRRRALLLMIVAPVLWSIAGVISRWLSPGLREQGGFEITMWRSVFAALFVAGWLLARHGGFGAVRASGLAGLLSGACWAVMFSCFMLALSLTTVANTLICMAVGPLLTAVAARVVLGTRLPARTWVAIAAACAGMAWMFAGAVGSDAPGRHALGMLVAMAVPVAAATNMLVLQRLRARVDLIPAVLVGGVLSAVLMLPLALPLKAGAADVAWLAVLGVFQLGLPCILMVMATRHLLAPEVALLALIEVVLGPLWTWLGAGEAPSQAALAGSAIVIGALVLNEAAGLRAARAAARG